MQVEADAAYAQAVAAQELSDARPPRTVRVTAQRDGGVLGRRRARRPAATLLRDDLQPTIRRHRQSLAGLVVFDILGLGVLLLQLTPGGFPLSFDEVSPRLEAPEVYDSVWLPIVTAAAGFSLLGLFGAITLLRPALWAHCAYLVAGIGTSRARAHTRAQARPRLTALAAPVAHSVAALPDLRGELHGGHRLWRDR